MSDEHMKVRSVFCWLPKSLYDGRIHWLKEVYTVDGVSYFPFRSHLDASCAQYNSQVDAINHLLKMDGYKVDIKEDEIHFNRIEPTYEPLNFKVD